MSGGWQDLVALALVAAAAAYLAVKLLRRPAPSQKPAGGCASGACGTCPLTPGAAPGARCDDPAPASVRPGRGQEGISWRTRDRSKDGSAHG
jgi:hypothetical protein